MAQAWVETRKIIGTCTKLTIHLTLDILHIENTQWIDQGHSDEKESLTLILFAETIGTSIRKGFEMPKRDCLMFDGNPMNYPRFIENFKTNIEEREQSPRVRLAYLVLFCTGVAKEAICKCVMLSEDEGYLKAREILHNSFGKNHIIICAYINKVTKEVLSETVNMISCNN